MLTVFAQKSNFNLIGKEKRIVLYLLIASSLLVGFVSTTFATDRTVPVRFSVTNTCINRFIASQWGSSNFANL